MVSVNEAKACIAQHSSKLPPLHLPLIHAAGYTLAEDVYAITDIPAFEQSSMDGYAILFEDKDKPLSISGEMEAGAGKKIILGTQEAVRIFTGAPLPHGADTVVMQEKVRIENGKLIIDDPQLQKGLNVRPKGAEIRSGRLAMQKGIRLSPAAIGFLAGIGTTHVSIYPPPKVCIIATGKELQKPGNELEFGQVYESNSFSLTAALTNAGITDIQLMEADDNLAELTYVFKTALENSDMVLLTGGISVGDYDFVLEASALCGVEKLFHKVKQRPGKPLFFGKTDGKLVFGLPGNPSSVLSCFYHFVLPSIETMTGRTGSLKVIKAELTHDFTSVAGLTQFLKGHYEDGRATPLSAQESYRLSSFAHANCMIGLEEERISYQKGEQVDVYLLPD